MKYAIYLLMMIGTAMTWGPVGSRGGETRPLLGEEASHKRATTLGWLRTGAAQARSWVGKRRIAQQPVLRAPSRSGSLEETDAEHNADCNQKLLAELQQIEQIEKELEQIIPGRRQQWQTTRRMQADAEAKAQAELGKTQQERKKMLLATGPSVLHNPPLNPELNKLEQRIKELETQLAQFAEQRRNIMTPDPDWIKKIATQFKIAEDKLLAQFDRLVDDSKLPIRLTIDGSCRIMQCNPTLWKSLMQLQDAAYTEKLEHINRAIDQDTTVHTLRLRNWLQQRDQKHTLAAQIERRILMQVFKKWTCTRTLNDLIQFWH